MSILAASYSSASTILISGLRAQTTRIDAIASNLANQDTTRGANGEPYQRKIVQFSESAGGGVQAEMTQDDSDPQLVLNPTHPDANADGMVAMPDIDMAQELVDLTQARQAFAINAAALAHIDETQDSLLDLLA